MIEVVGIRFKKAGKIYYFDPNGQDVKKDDYRMCNREKGYK